MFSNEPLATTTNDIARWPHSSKEKQAPVQQSASSRALTFSDEQETIMGSRGFWNKATAKRNMMLHETSYYSAQLPSDACTKRDAFFGPRFWGKHETTMHEEREPLKNWVRYTLMDIQVN